MSKDYHHHQPKTQFSGRNAASWGWQFQRLPDAPSVDANRGAAQS